MKSNVFQRKMQFKQDSKRTFHHRDTEDTEKFKKQPGVLCALCVSSEKNERVVKRFINPDNSCWVEVDNQIKLNNAPRIAQLFDLMFLFTFPHSLQYISRANSQGGQVKKMGSRGQISGLLSQLEHDLKTLEIAYEKYFLGTEKRAPEMARQKFTLHMRKMITYYIPQTDLRYKLQSISSRFNSYCGYWDRVLRLIDEGRYERHTSRINRSESIKPPTDKASAAETANPVDNLYEELVAAHKDCELRPPNREQVANFLSKQKEAIQERFGDKKVDFVVVTEAGKPKIKVRAKR
jgi:hypothetical protein